MTWLITGANGIIGRALCREARDRAIEVVGLCRRPDSILEGRARLIIQDLLELSPKATYDLLSKINPTVVAHLAGTASLDECDRDKESAKTLHLTWPSRVLEWCQANGVPLIYPSSIAVFDGNQTEHYQEKDKRNPLSYYGQLKMEAEDILSQYGKTLIFRSAAVFGVSYRPNGCFPEQLLRGIPNGKRFRLFTDVPFAPIDSRSLVRVLLDLVERGLMGVFHISGAEVCSRWEFGQRLIELAGLDLSAVEASQMSYDPLLTPRPRNQVLDSQKVALLLRRQMPTLDNTIRMFLKDFGQ